MTSSRAWSTSSTPMWDDLREEEVEGGRRKKKRRGGQNLEITFHLVEPRKIGAKRKAWTHRQYSCRRRKSCPSQSRQKRDYKKRGRNGWEKKKKKKRKRQEEKKERKERGKWRILVLKAKKKPRERGGLTGKSRPESRGEPFRVRQRRCPGSLGARMVEMRKKERKRFKK